MSFPKVIPGQNRKLRNFKCRIKTTRLLRNHQKNAVAVQRLEHWDVNNENLHGDFYEQRTGNPNITMKMFRDIHSVDQNVKLFLNDFSIVQAENSNRATVS